MKKHHRSDFYIFFIVDAVCGIFAVIYLFTMLYGLLFLPYYGFLEDALMVQYFLSIGILC